MRNFNSLPRSGAAVLLVGALATASCGGSNEDINSSEYVAESPVELAKQRGISIAQLFDQEFATVKCMTDTPYDPIRTDGGAEASVKISDRFDYLLVVTPMSGSAQSSLGLEVEAGRLVPNRFSDQTFKGYINCKNSS